MYLIQSIHFSIGIFHAKNRPNVCLVESPTCCIAYTCFKCLLCSCLCAESIYTSVIDSYTGWSKKNSDTSFDKKKWKKRCIFAFIFEWQRTFLEKQQWSWNWREMAFFGLPFGWPLCLLSSGRCTVRLQTVMDHLGKC